MGSIFGIIRKDGGLIDEKAINQALESMVYQQFETSGTWIEENVGFGYSLLITSSRNEKENQPYFHEDSSCAIVADCRIDYREELVEKLSLSDAEADVVPDSELILLSYVKWGKGCLNHLIGEFSFAIWNGNKKELFCARDHIGCRPFNYYEDNRYFIFSSRIKGLISYANLDIRFDQNMIPWLITSTVYPEERTSYNEIRKLLPSSNLVLRSDYKLSIEKYWQMQVDPKVSNMNEEDAINTFRILLENSVYQRIKDVSSVGLELSGGLDSSSIAALVKKVKPKQLQVISFTNSLTDEQKKTYYPFKDESDLSTQVADFTLIKKRFFVNGEGGRGCLDAVQDFMNLTYSPVIQMFSAMSDLLLDMAKLQKAEVLLSGFGGDECVTHQAKGIIDEFAANGNWEKLYWHLHQQKRRHFSKKYFVFIKLYIKHKILIAGFNVGRIKRKKIARYMTSDLALEQDLTEMYQTQIKQLYNIKSIKDFSVRNQQKKRLFHVSLSDRLENSYYMARERGIEYAYPFLDIKLLQFVYSLPAEYKNRNGQGRYLMRQVMRGLLPDAILARNYKLGQVTPNVSYRIETDKEKFIELVLESRNMNQFHYVDYDKLLYQLEMLSNRNQGKKISFGPRIFISSISILILQKWQREGKIDIGIKC